MQDVTALLEAEPVTQAVPDSRLWNAQPCTLRSMDHFSCLCAILAQSNLDDMAPA
jgi:hypothetical protein